MALIIWLVQMQVALSQHFAVQVNEQFIEELIDSAIDSRVNEQGVLDLEIPEGRISQKVKVNSDKSAALVDFVDGFLGINVRSGLEINLFYGKLKVAGRIKSSDIKLSVRKIAANNFRVKAVVAVDRLKTDLSKLFICDNKNCKNGAYVKFQGINLRQINNGVPIKLVLSLRAKLVDGKLYLSVDKIDNNLGGDNPPRIDLNYFVGKKSGKEWPQISYNQVGPRSLGISYSREDLVEELDLFKDDLIETLMVSLGEFASGDLVDDLNKIFANGIGTEFKGKYQGKGPVVIDTRNEVQEREASNFEHYYRQDNTYVDNSRHIPYRIVFYESIIDQFVNSIDYNFNLVELEKYNDDKILEVMAGPDIRINGAKVRPSNVIGYNKCSYGRKFGNCQRAMGKLKFDNEQLKSNSNIAVAISEPFINSLLSVSKNEGVLPKLVDMVVGMPGVYLSNHGVKIHMLNGVVYAVINLKILLKEQSSWIESVIGGAIENRWGKTNGEIVFPIEIPLNFRIEDDGQGESSLLVNGLSPFLANGELANMHGYPSNLDKTARTWFVKIKKKILSKIHSSLKDLIDESSTIKGRMRLKEQRIPMSALSKKLPFDLTPTHLDVLNSGHMAIYGMVKDIKVFEKKEKKNNQGLLR